MARPKSTPKAPKSTASLGFEAKLWLTADKLRNNMDAAEYKHVVLGLIFLKYISDTFEEHRAKLLAGKGEYKGANAEDRDEYLDKAFVDFTKMMEDLAGIKNPMEDNKRLEEAKKQTQANKPPPVPNDIDAGRLGQFMGFINDRSQKLTTPQQMGRMSEFGRDMSKRLAGGSLSKPKAAPPTPAPSPGTPK